MLPVTHPKVLRSPNQIRTTLSAAHQICLCLHRCSLCGHTMASTCLCIQIISGQNKRCRSSPSPLEDAIRHMHAKVFPGCAMTDKWAALWLHEDCFIIICSVTCSTQAKHVPTKISALLVRSKALNTLKLFFYWSIELGHTRFTVSYNVSVIYKNPQGQNIYWNRRHWVTQAWTKGSE